MDGQIIIADLLFFSISFSSRSVLECRLRKSRTDRVSCQSHLYATMGWLSVPATMLSSFMFLGFLHIVRSSC